MRTNFHIYQPYSNPPKIDIMTVFVDFVTRDARLYFAFYIRIFFLFLFFLLGVITDEDNYQKSILRWIGVEFCWYKILQLQKREKKIKIKIEILSSLYTNSRGLNADWKWLPGFFLKKNDYSDSIPVRRHIFFSKTFNL